MGDRGELPPRPGATSDHDGTVAWSEFGAEAERRLNEAGYEQASLEARWLVEEAAGFGPGEWFERRGELATVRGVARFDDMIERRIAGEPIQYVLGHWQFRMLDLMVDRRVLIPRPETEVLAGLAIERLSGLDAPIAVDLGTGSGAVGLSLAFEHPTVQVWLTDKDRDALSVARANLAGLGRHGARVVISEGDWFEALPEDLVGTVDLVVSNPPYIAEGEDLPRAVADFEPAAALFSGSDGLSDLTAIVDRARGWLRPGGHLLLEMSPDQTEPIAGRALAAGFDAVEVVADLAGRDRVVTAVAP